MNKKVLHVLLSVLLVLSFAASTAEAQSKAPPSVAYPKLVIKNWETGQKIELPVEVKTSDYGSGLYGIQYDMAIPASILAANVAQDAKWDSTYSVYGTLQQYYWEMNYGGVRWVKVDKYMVKWTRSDSTVSMSNANQKAGCFGDFYDGGVCSKSETKTIGTPTSGTWYTQVPSWASKYVSVGGIMFQAGNATVTLKRGGATWSLFLCVAQGGGC